MVDGVQLESRLWTAAQTRARAAGFEFASNCARQLRDFIPDGVARLAIEKPDDPQAPEEAERHLVEFVDRMIVAAREMRMTELQESTFLSAKSWLCPLWPFC